MYKKIYHVGCKINDSGCYIFNILFSIAGFFLKHRAYEKKLGRAVSGKPTGTK
jgi:hypothetical protein